MSHVAKLSLAVLLALMAAGLNAMWLSAAKRPPTFVAMSIDVPEGQEIVDEMLTSMPVPGDADKLRESLIPYASRALLFGVPGFAQLHRRRRRLPTRPASSARIVEVRGPRAFPADQRGRAIQNIECRTKGFARPAKGATTSRSPSARISTSEPAVCLRSSIRADAAAAPSQPCALSPCR